MHTEGWCVTIQPNTAQWRLFLILQPSAKPTRREGLSHPPLLPHLPSFFQVSGPFCPSSEDTESFSLLVSHRGAPRVGDSGGNPTPQSNGGQSPSSTQLTIFSCHMNPLSARGRVLPALAGLLALTLLSLPGASRLNYALVHRGSLADIVLKSLPVGMAGRLLSSPVFLSLLSVNRRQRIGVALFLPKNNLGANDVCIRTQARLYDFSQALNLCLKMSLRAVSGLSVILEAADDSIYGVKSNRIKARPVRTSSVGTGKRATWHSS